MASDQNDGGASTLRSIGVAFLVCGLLSIVLPYMGVQLRIMKGLADYQPWAGIGIAAVGAVFLAVVKWQSSGE